MTEKRMIRNPVAKITNFNYIIQKIIADIVFERILLLIFH